MDFVLKASFSLRPFIYSLEILSETVTIKNDYYRKSDTYELV